MTSKEPNPRRHGFTLMELLVSMVIASLIMILLLGLMEQSSSTYRDSQSAVSTLSETRAFFHFFKSDLSSRLPNSPLMTEESGDTPDKIAFVRVTSMDEQIPPIKGDLSTSLYYVAFTNDRSNSVSPKLFRKTLDTAATLALIESSASPAIPTGSPTEDEPLAYNVVNFQVDPKQYTPSGELEPWTPTSGKPAALLEVTIDLTDGQTAARLKTESMWTALRDPTSIEARKSVRRFTRTIRLAQ